MQLGEECTSPFQVKRAGREIEFTTQKYKADCRWSIAFVLFTVLLAIKTWIITTTGARVRLTIQKVARIGCSHGDESGLVFSLANRMVGRKAADSVNFDANMLIAIVGFGQRINLLVPVSQKQ